jgi:hypothetical protein
VRPNRACAFNGNLDPPCHRSAATNPEPNLQDSLPESRLTGCYRALDLQLSSADGTLGLVPQIDNTSTCSNPIGSVACLKLGV